MVDQNSSRSPFQDLAEFDRLTAEYKSPFKALAEMERRKANAVVQPALEPGIDSGVMQVAADVVDNFDYDPSTSVRNTQKQRAVYDRDVKKTEATMSWIEKQKAAIKGGKESVGFNMAQGIAGLAEAWGDAQRDRLSNLERITGFRVPKRIRAMNEAIGEWGRYYGKAFKEHAEKHPEEMLQLEKEGFIGGTQDILSNPGKIIQGGLNSIDLMLSGVLPGGTALMAAQMAGQQYVATKEEEPDPDIRLIRAFTTAVPNAMIERYTLSKKLTLFKSLNRTPLRKALWEGAKAYARGSAEEGTQKLNENLWKKVFTDRDQPLLEGIGEAAAAGGPIEAMFSGTAMVAGSARRHIISNPLKVARVNIVRDTVIAGLEGDTEAIAEVNKSADKVIDDIRAGVYDAAPTENESVGADYGLTNEEIKATLDNAEQNFQRLSKRRRQAKKKGSKLSDLESGEYQFLKNNRGDIGALIERSTDPASEFSYVVEPKKPGRRRTEFVNAVNNARANLESNYRLDGYSNDEAAAKAGDDYMQALLIVHDFKNKSPSVKELSRSELADMVDLLADSSYGGTIPDSAWDATVTVGKERLPMVSVMQEAHDTAIRLPLRGKKSSSVSGRRVSRLRTAGRQFKKYAYDTANLPLYALAKMFDGGNENGVYSRVLAHNIAKGYANEVRHKRTSDQKFNEGTAKLGIGLRDALRLSRSLDPRLRAIKAVVESIPQSLLSKTESMKVDVGTVQADLTYGELIDIYMMSEQKAGVKHLLNGGLLIGETLTGGLTTAQLANIRSIVEADAQAIGVVKLMHDIETNHWKPSINATSIALDGKRLATVENWWGLEAYHTKGIVGKKIGYRRQSEYSVNLLENRGIFKQRSNSSLPLVVRDAFNRYAVFSEAIAQYVGMADPFRTARTLMSSSDNYIQFDQKGYGEEYRTAIELMKRQQSSMTSSASPFDGVINAIMPNVYRAFLYYNPKVWASQYTSVLNYGSYTSLAFMPYAFKAVTVKGNTEALNEMLAVSDIAYDRYRSGKATLEAGTALESGGTVQRLTGKGLHADAFSAVMKYSDIMALLGGWQIAKAEFAASQDGSMQGKSSKWWAGENTAAIEEGSPEYFDVVRRRAEYLWQHTQPSWDNYNRTLITSAPKFVRSFLLFRSFREKVLTIWNEAHTDLANGGSVSEFADRVSWPIASMVTNQLIRIAIGSLIYRERKTVTSALMDTVGSVLDTMPVVGNAINGVLKAFVRGITGDEDLYVPSEAAESLPLQLVNTTYKHTSRLSEGIGKLIESDGDDGTEIVEKAILNILYDVSPMIGLPGPQIKKAGKAWITDESDDNKRRERKVH